MSNTSYSQGRQQEEFRDDDDVEYDDEGNVISSEEEKVEEGVPNGQQQEHQQQRLGTRQSSSGLSQQQESSKGHSKQASKKKKREINPKFKDVKETGKWGSEVGQKEMIIAVIFLIVVLAIVGIVVGIFYSRNKDESSTTIGTTPPRPTREPTLPPTYDDSLIFNSLLDQINANELTKGTTTSVLSSDLSFYDGTKHTDTTQAPQVRAIDWILNAEGNDNNEELSASSPYLKQIYALATLYYETSGEDWIKNNNWLDPSAPVCSWEGLQCDLKFPIVENIDLSSNNLQGTLLADTNELSLLRNDDLNVTVQALYFQFNDLQGQFPEAALGSLHNLIVILFQNNKLEGELPPDQFFETTNTEQFYVYNNLMTGGRVPTSMCTKYLNANDPDAETLTFFKFGIDCKKFGFCTCCNSEVCYD